MSCTSNKPYKNFKVSGVMNTVALSQYNGPFNSTYEGVTTVWLLSTLGNSRLGTTGTTSNGSNLRKKDIINVSIPKTCKIIQSGKLELPLRHVSNLLYGVTVCYHRKTEYVLNDLTGLLSQLQKKLYCGALSKKKMQNNNIQATAISNSKKNCIKSDAFLEDDPLFDINQTENLVDLFSTVPKQSINESLLIRRRDYMNELTNYNSFDNPETFQGSNSSRNFPNRSITLDDIPVDFDFNLDVDDVISRQGTALGSGTDSIRSSVDLHLNYNDREFSLNFEEDNSETNDKVAPDQKINDNTGINLGIAEDPHEDDIPQFEDNNFEPVAKRTKLSQRNDDFLFSKVQVDEKIGLSTDILRSYHSNYAEIMNSSRRAPISNKKFAIDFSVLNLDNNFLPICWESIFDDNVAIKNDLSILRARDAIERGRKRARSVASNSNSRTSSEVPSEEQGRRGVLSKENSFNDDDQLLLNLGQIDEDLEDNYSRAGSSYNRQEMLETNLYAPSSSFGRLQTRSNSRYGSGASNSSGSQEKDVVEELYKRTHRAHSGELLENDFGANFQQGNNSRLLDSQTKRFYDYIKDRAFHAGKTTNTNPSFSKKVLFEDIVPSKLSQSAQHNNVIALEKKIAASAFLSLLNLASKNMVGIKEYDSNLNSQAQFQLLNADDIIIYV